MMESLPMIVKEGWADNATVEPFQAARVANMNHVFTRWGGALPYCSWMLLPGTLNFDWGIASAESLRLSLAILAETYEYMTLHRKLAEGLYVRFCSEVISQIPREWNTWNMPYRHVVQWIKAEDQKKELRLVALKLQLWNNGEGRK